MNEGSNKTFAKGCLDDLHIRWERKLLINDRGSDWDAEAVRTGGLERVRYEHRAAYAVKEMLQRWTASTTVCLGRERRTPFPASMQLLLDNLSPSFPCGISRRLVDVDKIVLKEMI
jgi:hypothetical protein